MGKTTGFLQYPRQHEPTQPAPQRRRHWREFVQALDDASAQLQAARCMDCGVPFCHWGCPVGNVIPDFNDLVYRQDWQRALAVLHATNNFPEFTGRICPAPCEAACTLNIDADPVGIKSIEHKLIERGWQEGWVVPQPPAVRSGKRVAIVGSGPAGLACAQQLARAGHAVTVFEKNDRPGGLLRYGIPDFKLDKRHIDRRIEQLCAEGVSFRTGVFVGAGDGGGATTLAPRELITGFDATVIAGGAELPRDLPVPGRELAGVHLAMEYLPQCNRANAGDHVAAPILAGGKHVVVIGGGDTGSDCVGSAIRQGARSVTQFELLPQPPRHEDKALTWPYWPLKLRTSSSHEEGCERDWAVATQCFNADAQGRVASLSAVRLHWHDARMSEVPDSRFDIPAELVLLAMGFVAPRPDVLDAFGVERDARGNVRGDSAAASRHHTNVEGVFAAGDMRRGQSLVVWAIREGRDCARAVHEFLLGRERAAAGAA
ncbi:MAG: glutamate synthase subunit beta [Xanthomonadales bacterium]|nr:glutamate synthase subunit beta [Xanthomonadales bacterium]MDL1869403.1 glutamate synthase subunit beta [Gammaproteobacteria bacterium PRO6]